MNRTIVGVALVPALIATLFLWVIRDTGVSESIESIPVDTGKSFPPIVEPIKPADEPGDAPESAALRTEPNIMSLITRQRLPDIVSPPWSDEMENTILSYIAQHPGLELTSLQVQCAEEGCVVFMAGRNVPVYDMNFDVFAEEHQFDGAIVGGDSTEGRTVALRR